MKKFPFVLVEWVDSSRSDCWTPIDQFNPKVSKCMSVGWIIEQTKKRLSIAPHLGPGQSCGTMTIPKVAITKIRKLKVR